MSWLLGMNGAQIGALVIGGALTIVAVLAGITTGCALVLSGRLAREEEKADDELAHDLMRHRPATPVYREPSRTGRERIVIDYSEASKEDIAEALEPRV